MQTKKNEDLEKLLLKINQILEPAEKSQFKTVETTTNLPTILQIGSSRTGSTLFTQYLAATGQFSFPTNFLSRFYAAPYIGALIYEMTTNPKYNFRDEFEDIKDKNQFVSEFGKTRGFKSLHEFMYFWRHNFNIKDIPTDLSTFNKSANFDNFNKEIRLLQNLWGKPFLLKAHIVNMYLPSLSKNLDNPLFIHMYRNPIDNINSILKLREKEKGSIHKWASWKPREYDLIKDMDPYHQVAGQLYFIEKQILSYKKNLGSRYISFSYEEFCNHTDEIYGKIVERINKFSDKNFPKKNNIETTIYPSMNQHSYDSAKIQQAYEYFTSTYGSLQFESILNI